MKQSIQKFIDVLEKNGKDPLPAWLTAAVTELVLDFTAPAAMFVPEVSPAAASLPDVPKCGSIVTVESSSPIRMNPAHRLDINDLLEISGVPANSDVSALEVIQRVAGVVRVMAQVLALKHGGPEDAQSLSAGIIRCTALANELRDLAGGELDLASLKLAQIHVDKEPKPRRKMNITPEERQRRAERMRQISLNRHRHEAAGEVVSDDAVFPEAQRADADDVAGGQADARVGSEAA